jgi:hypothetical protein
MEYYYPRAAGKWSQAIQSLKSAWREGKETAMFTGQVFVPRQRWGEGLCPVCGGSLHTSSHVEKVVVKSP